MIVIRDQQLRLLVLAQLGLILRYVKLPFLPKLAAAFGTSVVGWTVFYLVTNFIIWFKSTPASPVYYPKTWEGLIGGLILSAVVAVAINRPLSVLRGGDLAAAGFGLVVGGTGALGDLAESLIKRDCRCKDASQVVPGFGGVLDVVDSVLFAAPAAYWWLR